MKRLIFKKEDLSQFPLPESGYLTIGIDNDGNLSTITDAGTVSTVGGGSSIYTESGTVPTSVVATLTDTLTFDLGTTATLLQRGIKLDADSIYYTSGSSLPIFEATNNNGQIFNLTSSGFLQTYSDLSGTIARLYARGGTQGLSLGANGTTLAVDVFKIQNTFGGGSDYFTFEVDPNFTQMYMANGGSFEHWLRTGTSAQATFFRNGINGSGFNVGGSGAIGSEKISLQARTLVQGTDTLSTSTAFEIYDGDTVPSSLYSFRNDGRIIYNGSNPLVIGSNTINVSGASYTNILIGSYNTMSNASSRVIGNDNNVSGSGSVCIGGACNSTGNFTINVGTWLNSTATSSSIIGYGVNSSNKLSNSTSNSLALGWSSTTPQHLFFQTGAYIGGGSAIGTEDISLQGDVLMNNNVNMASIPTYADDTAAGTGGLTSGDIYKTSTGELRIKL